ncbi:MAG: GNAT family N-acetyltransferase [Chloroflexi bacterium]|nr:GNAT family N-acetyltransferase [Chloroflexota bacterium]
MKIIRANVSQVDALAPMFDDYRVFYGQQSDIEGARRFLRTRLENNESVVFIAVDDEGHGLGFVQLYPSFTSTSMRKLWILNDLFVTKEARGTGVATALLERARVYAIETHARGLTLQTAIDNEAAQKLYEKLGWRRDEEFYTYYIDA